MENLYMEPYAEDDAKLNDFVDNIMHRINWNTFENQEKYVYMSGELGERRFPQLKDFESVWNAFSNAYNDAMSWLKVYMWERWLRSLRLGNVDLGEDMEHEMRELMGDEYFEEWDAAARQYIYDDYVKFLGEEKAAALFREAWNGWEK